MNTTTKKLFLTAIFICISAVSFAETEAPVFDADNLPPFDGQQPADASQPSSNAALPLRQQVARLEQQLDSLKQSGSGNRVEELQKEVQTLRGQVEELTHALQQAQTQQRSMYSDLDSRLTKQMTPKQATPKNTNQDNTSDKPVQPAKSDALSEIKNDKKSKTLLAAKDPVAEPVSKNNQPDVAEEQQIYQTAYNYIKAKKYDDAVTTLRSMLQKYPSGQFAANAHYWLGELYGLMNKNDQSAAEFGIVVKDYANSPKVSDAQLKLGLIYAAQFKWADAKGAFKTVINQYPGTTSARIATEQLKQIKQAGY